MVLKNISELTPAEIAANCDHTYLLTPSAYRKEAKEKGVSPVDLRQDAYWDFMEDIIKLSEKGLQPYSACVRPEDVENTRKYLDANNLSDMKVASVIGFPNGNLFSIDEKVRKIQEVLDKGAGELDPVIFYNKLKEGDTDYIKREVEAIQKASNGAPVKTILENSQLTDYMIEQACKICDEAGVDFVKEGTGFGIQGATPHTVGLMRKMFPRGVKIAGSFDEETAQPLIYSVSGREDGKIEDDPMFYRIGESGYLKKFLDKQDNSY